MSCLRDNHSLRTVGDFVDFVNGADNADHNLELINCECTMCETIREDVECENPAECMKKASEILAMLPPRWDPRGVHPEDYENLHAGIEPAPEGAVWFDRRVTTKGHLGNAFRIFTGPEPVCNERLDMRTLATDPLLTVATDGSCIRNGETDAVAGAGVYVADNHPMNRSLRLPETLHQSNQTGEMVATLIATTLAPEHAPLLELTDSKTVMDGATKLRQRHEDEGYITQGNAHLSRAIVAGLRQRRAPTAFKWVKGHSGHPMNEAADSLAGNATGKERPDDLAIVTPRELTLTGAKLPCITQKLAYRAIRSIKERSLVKRPRTETNLQNIASELTENFSVSQPSSTIWNALKSQHMTREASYFYWMAIHDAYMIGNQWLRPKMPDELKERAMCRTCGNVESMDHVLFRCDAPGQQLVWKLLEDLWSHTGLPWHEPGWGALGAGCAVIKTEEGLRRPESEALWTILCSEAAHLVWKLRCERVIRNEGVDFTEQEIRNRWHTTMDRRLTLDRRTSVLAKGKKDLQPGMVERIWFPVIEGNLDLPPEWVTNSEVLVGIKRGR